MNYNHAFHAGNSADVFKHVFLLKLLRAMQQTGEQFRAGKINIHTANSPAVNRNIANGGTHAE